MPSVSGIVLELKRMSSKSSIPVSDLLRTALCVARELKIIDQEPWIQSELNGYLTIDGNYDALPNYRFVKSKIDYEKIQTVGKMYCDIISLGINPSNPHENTEKYPCHVPVPEIERALEDETKNNFVHIPCQPDVEAVFIETMKLPPSFPIVLTVQAWHLRDILEAVRNRILDWASQLEEKGISGGNSSFSKDMLDISEAAIFANVCTKTIRNWLTQVDGDKPMIAGVTGKGRLTRIPKKALTPYIKKDAPKKPVKRN